MENCTLYSHQLDFKAIEDIIISKLPKATIDINDGGSQKQLTATVKGGFFSKAKTLKISYREREQPSYDLKNVNCPLSKNLAGMANFIQSFPADNADVKNQLLHKVMSCNSEIPFMAEPKIDADFKSVLVAIANKLDAIIFAQPNSLFNKSNSNHFTDKDLKLVLDQEGRCEISKLNVTVDAKYHDQPTDDLTKDQIARKLSSENSLRERGVKVNANLPTTPSQYNIKLRSNEEVCSRLHALMVIAVKGEGLEQDKIKATMEGRKINGLSPKELTIIEKETLDDDERAYATWRYESLNALLWAAGVLPDLTSPDKICDVPKVVGAIMAKKRSVFDEEVMLRSKEDILSQLDLIYRMNWACVDARIKNETVSGNLNPSVVYERHYLFNWLTNHQSQEWDDIQTTT